MSGEELKYTEGEVQLLVAVSEVKTMQKMHMDLFNDHKDEDETHFKNLYDADKQILSEIQLIPGKMIVCSESIKTDVLKVARKEFTPITEFKVFRTWVITGMTAGITVGSIVGAVISYFLKLGGH